MEPPGPAHGLGLGARLMAPLAAREGGPVAPSQAADDRPAVPGDGRRVGSRALPRSPLSGRCAPGKWQDRVCPLQGQQFRGAPKEARFPLLPKTVRVLYSPRMSSGAVYGRNFDCEWQHVQDQGHSQCGVKQMVQSTGLVSFHSQVL
ncbi:unnamed protein product [Coccothraustes coccothraustes]